MNTLKGEPWINSASRRAFELFLVNEAAPAVGVIALVASGALKLSDAPENLLNEVERAILPNQTFTVRKLSNPHSKSRVAKVCRIAMIDEFPQFVDILKGYMSFFGPRGSEPGQVNLGYESLRRHRPNLYIAAMRANQVQKPGFISTYAIYSHAHNLDGLTEEARFPGGSKLDANIIVRQTFNVQDFEQTSFFYDLGLLGKSLMMVKGNYSKLLAK